MKNMGLYASAPTEDWNAVLLQGDRKKLKPSWRSVAQFFELPTSADSGWSITPASLQMLQTGLVGAAEAAQFHVVQTFSRPGPADAETVSIENYVTLSAADTAQLIGVYGSLGRVGKLQGVMCYVSTVQTCYLWSPTHPALARFVCRDWSRLSCGYRVPPPSSICRIQPSRQLSLLRWNVARRQRVRAEKTIADFPVE
jgi:hypothetical protein